MRAGILLALLALPLLTGCKREDMWTQRSLRSWDLTRFFADGSAMRHPPEGTVPRQPVNPDVPPPATITAALLDRGRERYAIFCTPCHGSTGHGDGMIVQRGFPRPPSLVDGSLRTASSAVLFDAITKGYGTMYSFASRVPPADRWAVIAYVRALQRSQNTAVASLPPELRDELAASR